MEIQKDVRVGDTANNDTWSSPTFSPRQLNVAPYHGRVSRIDVFSRLGSVTC